MSASADAPARRKRTGRKLVTRWIPGGVAVVAALTLPELSVGAGDLGGGEGRDAPPAPPANRGVKAAGLVQPLDAGPLAGVRYGGLLALGESRSRTAFVSPAITAAAPLGRSEDAGRFVDLAPSVPVIEAEAFVPPAPPPVVVPRMAAPAAAPQAAAIIAPPPQPAAPVAAVAAAALPAVPEAPPAARFDPPAAAAPASTPLAVPENPAFAAFQPEERAALAAPLTASAPVPVARAVAPAPAPAPVAVAPAAPARLAAGSPVAKAPAGRGSIDQVAQARPAPPKPVAPAPAAARPAPSVPPTASAAKVAAPAVAAARPGNPGARPPLAASAPVPAPARAAPAPAAKPAAAARPSVGAPARAAPPASAPAAASAPKPAIAAVPRAPAPLAAAPGLGTAKPAYKLDIKSQLVTRVDGKTAGAVDFRQTEAGLTVRLGSIVEVLADRLDPAQLARIRGSQAGNTWLSLAELQAQGIPISYDPVYDEFNVGHTDTRPKAGRKVHMDQITAPERGIGATGIDQVRR